MASCSGNGSRGHHKFTLNVWESYVSDGASNYSTVNWELVLSPLSNGWDWHYSSTVPVIWNVSIDGHNYSGNIMSYDGRSTVTVGSGSLNITHDSEGYKSIGFNFEVYDNVSASYLPGYASNSGNMTLTTIARASSVTATNTDIESATSININRASGNFKHTLRYSFSNLSGTIATNVDTSYGWTIPSSFYAKIPNSKTGICTIYCDTYSGNTLIGTKSTTFTVTANENLCKPEIQGAVVDTNEDTILLTGNNNVIVRYNSIAHVTYNSTAKNSASISNVKINGVTMSTQSGNYDFEETEAVEYEIVVTDTRGYSTILLLQPSIVDYIPLTISPYVFRTSPTTGQVSVSFSGNYFNDSFGDSNNQLQVGYFYREKGSSTWLYGGVFTENTNYVINNNTYHSGTGNTEQSFILNNTFDYTKVYEIRVWCADKLSNGMIDFTVAKGKPIVNWEEDFFNVNGKFKINGTEILNFLYPIGSIYISVNNTNPSTFFGGTWVAWGTGRVPVGVDTNQTEFNTVEKTGGSKNLQQHSHTGTVNYDGEHAHQIGADDDGGGGANYTTVHKGGVSGSGRQEWTSTNGGHTHTFTTNNAGTGDSGNLQPYITCYMWKRTN